MIDVTSVSDFNLHFVGQYSGRAFLVAGRFFDLTKDWERLSCEWYAKNGFGEPKTGDRYIGQLPDGRDAIRYHSVDTLVLENPKVLSELGQHLYDNWQARKAELVKHRNEPPPVVVLPPPLEPPMYEPKPEPKAKPIELPPKQEEPNKPRPEWRVKLGVYLSIGTPVIILLSSLLGPPWNTVAKFIWELLKTLNGG